MSEIKKGCRAVISKGKFKGTIVTVGEFIGAWRAENGYFHLMDDLWEIDKPVTITTGEIVYFKSESYLQRTDDDDVALGSWEELADIWQPKELVV